MARWIAKGETEGLWAITCEVLHLTFKAPPSFDANASPATSPSQVDGEEELYEHSIEDCIDMFQMIAKIEFFFDLRGA